MNHGGISLAFRLGLLVYDAWWRLSADFLGLYCIVLYICRIMIYVCCTLGFLT